MRVLLLTFLLLAPLVLFPGTADADRSYTVRPGDTLTRIARRFHVTIDELKRANRMRGENIREGMQLTIPAGSDGGGGRNDGRYTVRPGDTLSRLAARYRVPVRDLRRLNRLRNDRIRVGQRIRIPGRRHENPLPRLEPRPLRADQVAAGTRATSIGLGSVRAAHTLMAGMPEERWLVAAAEAPATIPAHAYGVGASIVRDAASEAILDEEATLGIVSEEIDAAPTHEEPELEDVALHEEEEDEDGEEEPEVEEAVVQAPSASLAEASAQAGPGTIAHPLGNGGHFMRGWGSGMAGSHLAVDLYELPSSPVMAAERGIVAYAGTGLRGYGRYIVVLHPNGLVTAYAHNRENLVVAGELVARGQVIARLGNTGISRGPHLHFILYHHGETCDPLPYMRPFPRTRGGSFIETTPALWESERPAGAQCLPQAARPHPHSMRRFDRRRRAGRR